MGLRRGDLAILSAPGGDYGKPRPALILQSDHFLRLDSVVVALLTSDVLAIPAQIRVLIRPTSENGLRRESEVMLDKLATMPRAKISEPIGRISDAEMMEVTAALALLLGM